MPAGPTQEQPAGFDWDALLNTLEGAPGQIQALLRQVPEPSSRASGEMASLASDQQRVSFLKASWQRALAHIPLAGEALVATTRLLRLPPVEVMSGPVVRAGLIASGVILWLMDPEISPHERVARTLGVLAGDNAKALDMVEKGKKAAAVAEVQSRIGAIAQEVNRVGDQFESASRGLSRRRMPTDEALARLSDSEYEYKLYTHIAHGTPAVVGEMHAMFQHSDEIVRGSALVNYVITLVHAYCQAGWALGSYTLAAANLERLKQVLVSLYKAMQANPELYSYLIGEGDNYA